MTHRVSLVCSEPHRRLHLDCIDLRTYQALNMLCIDAILCKFDPNGQLASLDLKKILFFETYQLTLPIGT